MKDPQPLEIEETDVEQLIQKAEHGTLDAAEQKRLVPLLRTLVWIQRALLETRISLSRLRRILFGKKTEKRPRKPKDPDSGSDGGGEGSGGNPEEGCGSEDPPADNGEPASGLQSGGQQIDSNTKKRRGHGRRAAADYPGAETVFCPHDEYRSGDRCPQCERGWLYHLPSLVRLRFTGQPLALVRRYERERLRCGTCGYLTVAPLPLEATGERYRVSLKVTLAVAHYHLGLPFKRIESFQDMLGMPLPDATQWEQVEQVADSAYPVYEYLKKMGANQPLVYQDDTGARILTLIAENQADPPPERKGMYTTVLWFEGQHSICLYFSGRRHAGENLDDILAYRDPDLPPIQWMSDGLAANTPKQHQDQTIDINCIAHGRRKLVELEEFFPNECTRVIDAIAAVYKHEAHCKDQQLTAVQRLAYHQEHSREVMDSLKAWMQKQFADRCVEPNSRLGGAFDYLLKRWESLTRFLEIPGAPLDNNAAERALKMILRLRKNSLFYKNEHGAYVGDTLISLIETCRLAGANPLDYLSALMENRSAVFADPGAWLPWNYRETLEDSSAPSPLGHSPPVLGQLDRLGVPVPQ
ncbi:MAG: IS66 family transposase [Sulfitobacter sp.]|nr:IS66 family transposase [Sulfitobacter sp.]